MGNVEHLNYSDMFTTSDERCGTREIEPRTAIAKAEFNKENFYKQTGLTA